MQQFKVTNYQLQGDNIIATISAAETKASITIDKSGFEHWLTNGTGAVSYYLPDLGIDNDLTGRIGKMPVEAFWEESPGVICSDILGYLCRSEGNKKETIAELNMQRSLDDIAALIPLSAREKAFIHLKMAQYGFSRSMATVEKMLEVRRY